ncbi:MAG: UTP--glucose-1-phosphate uridylyltransferase [Francisellaceae bacterium]|jgi:UTP--glucose-1-phosphate uridylyltransferase
MKLVRKAVFPVAGLGTRFLPATKASPKEMLTIVDKPLIQYAVEEAIEAGIEELIFVTSWHKRSIEDHFDKNFELEYQLEKKGKLDVLEEIRSLIPKSVNCVYVRQREALGLGHAVLCAKSLIGNEPFAVLLADDLIAGESKSCMAQMVEQYYYQNCGVLAVQEVLPSETHQYGIVEISNEKTIKSIVEKPDPKDAPSNLGVVGRYVLTHDIFNYLEKIPTGAGGEIQLTDAIAQQIKNTRMVAYAFKGKRYDCGDKLGFLTANFEFARNHPILGESFEKYVRKSIKK